MILFFTTLAIALSLSIDDFAAGTAYGTRRTHIPIKSMVIIVIGSTLSMLASMWLGKLLFGEANANITKYISTILLCGLGAWELYQAWLEDNGKAAPEKISFLEKPLNIWEAFYLGVALGIDDFAEAVALAAARFPVLLTVIQFKIAEIIMISAGLYLGAKGLSKHTVGKLAYIPGVVLFLVGLKQLF